MFLVVNDGVFLMSMLLKVGCNLRTQRETFFSQMFEYSKTYFRVCVVKRLRLSFLIKRIYDDDDDEKQTVRQTRV